MTETNSDNPILDAVYPHPIHYSLYKTGFLKTRASDKQG